jgi:transcriptional regulator with PAS, ATPase and Fis domain
VNDISEEALKLLLDYNWPGNVRELQNVLEQTLLLSPFMVVLPEHLPETLPSTRESGCQRWGSPWAL